MKIVKIENIEISNHLPFIFIGGPCQIESLDHALFMADNLIKITTKLKIPFIYKSSFDKANRSSITGKRGVGLNNGMYILEQVKKQFKCPIITDVHTAEQCSIVAEVVDILQIPAFLCRQTDLLKAASETKKPINVKKGQFLAPQDMFSVYEKLIHFGTKDILLTERGCCFGYNNLVVDMRSFPIMAKTNAPVIFDATHSVQKPGQLKDSSGGEREYVQILANAAVAVGVAGVFMEVHQDPDNAPSDKHCMVSLYNIENILNLLIKYDCVTKSYSI